MNKELVCRACGNSHTEIARVMNFCIGFQNAEGYFCWLCNYLRQGKEVILQINNKRYDWAVYRKGRLDEIPTPAN